MYEMLLYFNGGAMMSKIKNITVTIDGKTCHSEFGKTILQIARENDIYIPTMCYLTKVMSIASCRMCVVDVEGVDGMILSCQEPATDGIVISTNTPEIYKQRQSIMKLYDVNHPLECGVCDKSGECDLQNKTLEFDVAQQNFTAKDQNRKVQNWGHVSYDPALCIMCEKCVRVSTEITGDEALQVKFGGYNSTILNVKQDKNYSSLGEAAAVCPVGALVDTSFKYTSNAWELTKIPATCSHCSSGCELNYEIKQDSILNSEEKIYRVTNTYEFSSLCGAGRFGYDFENKDVTKDTGEFKKAVEAFKVADTIRFSAVITNEEALILQRLKEKLNYKLICDEAKGYQDFLKAFGEVTGKNLYSANLKTISDSRAIIVLGSKINNDNPMVKYHITMASKHNQSRVAYMHTIEDTEIQNIVTQFIKYEVGSEEGVVALLADRLLKDIELPVKKREFLDSLDIGYLSAESNIGEEELDALAKSLIKKRGFSLIVGEDLYSHPRAKNIAKILGLIETYTDFNILLTPPSTNALGVSLICDLDKEAGNYTIGYNSTGDYILSATGDGNLDMPSFNQQEGTITTIDKRVVVTNVALPYGGYTLNDLANICWLNHEYTIDYTKELPTSKGFSAVEFDLLPNEFSITGKENRGYLLTSIKVVKDTSLDEVEDLPDYDGLVVYRCNSVEQFSQFTSKTTQLKEDNNLVGSPVFATVAKIKDGDRVKFIVNDIEYNRVFKIDTSMKGTIAINPTNDMGLSSTLVSSYRYSKLKLEIQNKNVSS